MSPTRIQIRRDTAANWTSANPTLADGEPGLEKDIGRFKFGDGITSWSSLPYAASETGTAEFPSTPALDTFDRASEDPLTDGGDWVDGAPWALPSRLKTNGTQALSPVATGSWAGSSWAAACALPAEIWVSLDVSCHENALDLCWISNPTSAAPNGYYLNIHSTGTWHIARSDAGAETFIANGTISVGDGDSIGISIGTDGHIIFWHETGGQWKIEGYAIDTTYTGSGYIALDSGDATVRFGSFGGGTGINIKPPNSTPLGLLPDVSLEAPVSDAQVLTWDGVASRWKNKTPTPVGGGGSDYYSIKDAAFAGGATGDGTTDDTDAYLACLAYLHTLPRGGTMFLPPGIYRTAETGTITQKRISIKGCGRGISTIMRSADVPIVDMQGTNATYFLSDHVIEGVSFDGGGAYRTQHSDWNTSLITAEYLHVANFTNVGFLNCWGTGFETYAMQDCIFIDCRFDALGKGDGTCPAMRVYNTPAGGAVNDFSGANYFIWCVWESWSDGGCLFKANASGREYGMVENNFCFCKWDSLFLCGKAIEAYGMSDSSFENCGISMAQFYDGFSTPVDAMWFRTCSNLTFRNWSMVSNLGVTVENWWKIVDAPNGSICKFTFENIVMNGSSYEPNSAWIDIGSRQIISTTGVHYQDGYTFTKPLWAGTPWDVVGIPAFAINTGAISDTSFRGAPLFGAMGVDETNNRLYVKKSDGTWKYASLT